MLIFLQFDPSVNLGGAWSLSQRALSASCFPSTVLSARGEKQTRETGQPPGGHSEVEGWGRGPSLLRAGGGVRGRPSPLLVRGLHR